MSPIANTTDVHLCTIGEAEMRIEHFNSTKNTIAKVTFKFKQNFNTVSKFL